MSAFAGIGDETAAASGRWVLAGVAAELAARLRASPTFIRVLILIAAYLQFWPTFGIYCVAALVLPHDGRRLPDWSNLVGLLRALALMGVAVIGLATLSLDDSVFNQSPPVWIAFGGVELLLWLVVLDSRRPAQAVPAHEDRRVVLSAAPPVAAALALAAVMELFPQAPVGRLLDLVLIVLGLLGWVQGQRLNTRVYTAACLPLGLVALLLAGGGARLAGGVGKLIATPTSVRAGHDYTRAVGLVRLDLGRLRPGSGQRTSHWSANAGIGTVQIVVPADALTTVHVAIGSGNLSWAQLRFGHAQAFMLTRTIQITPSQASGGAALRARQRLTVDATVGRGCVEIESVSSQAVC